MGKNLSLKLINELIDIRLFFFFLLYQAPVGCVFFTGEHTSKKYSGYVHGAYLTGEEISQSTADYMSPIMNITSNGLSVACFLMINRY